MTVDAALDAFEGQLALVEAALDVGEAVELAPHDTTPLQGPVTPAHRERLDRALTRLATCQHRIQDQQAGIAEELGVIGARRGAAEAYASNR